MSNNGKGSPSTRLIRGFAGLGFKAEATATAAAALSATDSAATVALSADAVVETGRHRISSVHSTESSSADTAEELEADAEVSEVWRACLNISSEFFAATPLRMSELK